MKMQSRPDPLGSDDLASFHSRLLGRVRLERTDRKREVWVFRNPFRLPDKGRGGNGPHTRGDRVPSAHGSRILEQIFLALGVSLNRS